MLETGEGNFFDKKHMARQIMELEANVKAPPLFRRYQEKSQTFADFLREKHAEDYQGTDDDMPDAFDAWLGNLQVDDFGRFAEVWARTLV